VDGAVHDPALADLARRAVWHLRGGGPRDLRHQRGPAAARADASADSADGLVPIEDVLQKADEAGLRLVRFLWCGNDGTVRAKASSRHRLEGRLRAGIGLTVAMQAMNSLDQLQPVEGMGPVGEVRLVPDPETFRVLPYAPRSGAMLVDLLQLSGEPAPQCPRSFLKRMAARLEDGAGTLEVAFENEFSLA